MASKKIFHSRANSFFIAPGLGDARIKSRAIPEDSFFEFDEPDIWSSSNAISSMESRKVFPNSRVSSKKVSRKIESAAMERSHVTCSSLPVNIPDWSKIYKEERKGRDGRGDIADEDADFEDDVDEDHDGRLPPHEYLARRRGASFSVHEGIGRTLKGRDLRQVRNAIWKQVGFED